MTQWHPEINRYLLSNLRCYLDPKKHWRKKRLKTALLIFVPILVPHLVQHLMKLISLTRVTINSIAEELKVIGWRLVSLSFQVYKRIILNLLLKEFTIFQAYQLGSFAHNKLQNKQEKFVMYWMQKSMKLI